MEEVIGVIDSIYTKSIPIKTGARAGQDGTVYHAMINGEDINLGFKNAYSQGQQVSLNVERKPWGLTLVNGITPLSGSSATNTQTNSSAVPAQARATPRTSSPAFPVQPDTNGTSICRQSSLNRAVETIGQLIAAKVFAPKTEEEYLNKVWDIAYQYTDFVTGQREVKQAAAMMAYGAEE